MYFALAFSGLRHIYSLASLLEEGRLAWSVSEWAAPLRPTTGA